jgi:hypothetical protein
VGGTARLFVHAVDANLSLTQRAKQHLQTAIQLYSFSLPKAAASSAREAQFMPSKGPDFPLADFFENVSGFVSQLRRLVR